jgi:hypothetical protein
MPDASAFFIHAGIGHCRTASGRLANATSPDCLAPTNLAVCGDSDYAEICTS